MLASKFWVIVSAILMAVYVGYVVWSKFAAVMGPPPAQLSELGEFVLFSSSILAFVLQVFAEDAQRGTAAASPGDHP